MPDFLQRPPVRQVETNAANSITLDLLVWQIKSLGSRRACTLVLWLVSSGLHPPRCSTGENGSAYRVGRSRSPPSILKQSVRIYTRRHVPEGNTIDFVWVERQCWHLALTSSDGRSLWRASPSLFTRKPAAVSKLSRINNPYKNTLFQQE